MKNSQEKRENKVSFFANPSAKALCRAGVIAALYVALNYLLQLFSFGILQCRVSEALTVLPLLFPEEIPALFVGCVISNLIGNGIYDIIIGSLATLIAAVGTYLTGRFIKNKYLKFVLGGFFSRNFKRACGAAYFYSLRNKRECLHNRRAHYRRGGGGRGLYFRLGALLSRSKENF